MSKIQFQDSEPAVERTIQMDPAHLSGRVPSDTSVVSYTDSFEEVVIRLSFMDRLRRLRRRIFQRELQDVDAEISASFSKDEVLDCQTRPPENMYNLTDIYDVGETFASGGQSYLRYAMDRRFGRKVAVKTLQVTDMDPEEARTAFIREAQVTAQLEHPAVIPAYSLTRDPEDGMHFAMRYVSGMTLQKYLHKLILTYTRNGIDGYDERRNLFLRLEYFLRVCDAMEYAHARGVIHCDLKPENVMIGRYREVYVMDWGIARTSEDTREWVPPKTIVGTLRYLAPEIIRGKRPGFQSDIFSLGALLYELITLNNAFAASTSSEIVKLEKTGRIGAFRHRFGIRVNKDLEAIVRKATAPEPEDRYKTVKAMAADIRRVLRNEEISARPDSFSAKFIRWCANNPRGIAITFFSVFVITLSIFGISLGRAVNNVIAMRDRDAAIAGAMARTMLAAQAINTGFARQAQLLDSLEEEFLLLHDSGKPVEDRRVFSRRELVVPGGFKCEAMQPAPAYRRKVDFEHMTYSRSNPNVPLTAVQQKNLQIMNILVPRFRQILFRSGIGMQFITGTTDEQIEKELRKNGATPHQIVFGFADGMFAVYPGTDCIAPGFDPRNRGWYRHGMVLWNKQRTWVRPFRPFGEEGYQIACATPIYDKQNVYQGVIALEMDLDMLAARISTLGNNGPALKNKYVLDRYGFVCLKLGQEADNIPFRRQRIPEPVFEQIGRRPFGYWMETVGSKVYLWTFASLETPRWIYAERIDLTELEKSFSRGI